MKARKLYYKHFTPDILQHNRIFEFTALEHRFKRWFFFEKPVLNVRFKDFWYTLYKINPTQIWYDKFNSNHKCQTLNILHNIFEEVDSLQDLRKCSSCKNNGKYDEYRKL